MRKWSRLALLTGLLTPGVSASYGARKEWPVITLQTIPLPDTNDMRRMMNRLFVLGALVWIAIPVSKTDPHHHAPMIAQLVRSRLSARDHYTVAKFQKDLAAVERSLKIPQPLQQRAAAHFVARLHSPHGVPQLTSKQIAALADRWAWAKRTRRIVTNLQGDLENVRFDLQVAADTLHVSRP